MRDSDAHALTAELAGLPPAQRASRLRELENADPELAARVQDLLTPLQVETQIDSEPAAVTPTPAPAATLGPFRLLRALGSGGMGTVWLAEQQAPRRRVALKTIRADRLTPMLRARFDHEARFLAALDHPVIARVLAAGTEGDTATGTPWLAMDYVEGTELLAAADQAGLNLDARLRVLIQICEGVQHAHLRGVMHRDLKPANILVTAEGEPRILDFGVARAIGMGADAPVATRLTRLGEVIGTVEYMSPEQLAGDPLAVDARADVYALGVIAFELLTGKLPHTLEGLSLIEAIQRIQHQPPLRLAHARPELAGDLDLVVMKALAADPALRYQTPAAFAADLQAVRAHRPVQARAPGTRYLLGKWVRRNRLAAAAVLIALLSLLGATTWSLWAAERARAALAEAEARAAELGAVNTFVADMLTEADPELGGSAELTLGEVLERAGRTLRDQDHPVRTRGQVGQLLGRTWSGLGNPPRGIEVLDQAIVDLERGFGTDSPEALEARVSRAEARGLSGAIDEAIAELDVVVGRIEALPAADPVLHTRAGTALAQLVQARGDAAAAIQRMRALEDRFGEVLQARDPAVLAGLRYNLAYTLLFAGDFKEAETRLRAVVAEETQRLGAQHPQTLYSIKGLGQALHRQGRLDEAVSYYQTVHAERLRLYGLAHPATLNAATQLAAAYNALQRPADAEPLLRAVLEGRAQRNELDHPQSVAARNILAITLDQLDQREAAMALVRAALAVEARTGPNQETLSSRHILANLLVKNAQADLAAPEFDILLAQVPEVLGADHINAAVFLSSAAACDLARSLPAAALEKLERALPQLQARFGPEHARTREAQTRLVEARAAMSES